MFACSSPSAKVVSNLVHEVRAFFHVNQKISATTCCDFARRCPVQDAITSYAALSAKAEDSILPRLQALVHRHLMATADCQLPK
jgi:hypothetical protein